MSITLELNAFYLPKNSRQKMAAALHPGSLERFLWDALKPSSPPTVAAGSREEDLPTMFKRPVRRARARTRRGSCVPAFATTHLPHL